MKKRTVIFVTGLICAGLLLFYVGGNTQWNKGTATITVSYTMIGKTPIVETYMDNGKQKPIVIIQHGFKNKKESTLDLAEKLAKKGFFVVSPDAYGHGERLEEPLSLVQIIVSTSGEYDGIIASYEEDNRVNIDELGITGFSMGGCITFHYAVYGKYSPEAIAPTISTPYFEQLIGSNLSRSVYSVNAGLTVATDEETIAMIDEYILSNSPFKDCKSLEGTAILMQNGELDRYVDKDGVVLLKETLFPENPEVKLLMFPETKHKVTEVMTENIVDFMCDSFE